MGSLPRKAAGQAWNQLERKKGVAVNKAERGAGEYFDIKYGDAECGVFPIEFLSCFGLVFPHYAPFLPFGIVMHVLCHCMLEVYDLFYFYFIGGYS